MEGLHSLPYFWSAFVFFYHQNLVHDSQASLRILQIGDEKKVLPKNRKNNKKTDTSKVNKSIQCEIESYWKYISLYVYNFFPLFSLQVR